MTVWITTNYRKFFKRWEYQNNLPDSWEICMQVKKQQLELDMEKQTGSKSEKEYVKVVYCHPAYLTYMWSTWWEMPGWMKHKLESRFPGEISVNSDTQMTPPSSQKVKKKEHLDVSERGEWKVGLKLKIQKTKIMASSPITSWKIDGETMETVKDYFGGLQDHCRCWLQLEIKRWLLFGRKVMKNLDSILKAETLLCNKDLSS